MHDKRKKAWHKKKGCLSIFILDRALLGYPGASG